MMTLSIIIPVLNESSSIVERLQTLRQRIPSANTELVVVDGGSQDETYTLAKPYADKVIQSPKGRAKQMNAGAACASGDMLLFLHVDTVFPELPTEQLFPFLDKASPYKRSSDQLLVWGFYTLRLSGSRWAFRIIETMINTRSQFTRVATGDQCLFISTKLFSQLQGFADIPLMEDVDISKRLRRITPPWVVKLPVITSSRRWEQYGTVKTVYLMWYLRALYFFGVSPERLAKKY